MNRREFINLSGLGGLSLLVSMNLTGKIRSAFLVRQSGHAGYALEKMFSGGAVKWSAAHSYLPERSGKFTQTRYAVAQLLKTAGAAEARFTPPVGDEFTVRTNMTGANNQVDSGLFHEYTVQCDEGRKPELTFTFSAENPLPAYSLQPTENANEYLVRMIVPTDGNEVSEILNVYFGQVPTAIDNRLAPALPARVIELGRNYPDPFNSQTEIPYRVKQTTEIQIDVYDMLGRRITTLFKGQKTSGTYRAHWDGKDDSGKSVSSGLYLLKISASGYSVSRPIRTEPMLLVK